MIVQREADAMQDTAEFEEFFAFISDNFGDTAFSRSRDGEAFGRLAPAYFEAVVGALAGNLNLVSGKSSAVADRLGIKPTIERIPEAAAGSDSPPTETDGRYKDGG